MCLYVLGVCCYIIVRYVLSCQESYYMIKAQRVYHAGPTHGVPIAYQFIRAMTFPGVRDTDKHCYSTHSTHTLTHLVMMPTAAVIG